MNFNVDDLIPQHKHDHESVEALKKMPLDSIRPFIPQLMIWLQDGNWPVSPGVQGVLAPFGKELIPHIRYVFQTDDSEWKYFLLIGLVSQLSRDVLIELKQDLLRLIEHPSPNDIESEVNETAMKVIALI